MPGADIPSKIDLEAPPAVSGTAVSAPTVHVDSCLRRHRCKAVAALGLLGVGGFVLAIAGLHAYVSTVPDHSVWRVVITPGTSEFDSLDTPTSRTFTTHLDLSGTGPRWHTTVQPWPGKLHHFVTTPTTRYSYVTSDDPTGAKTECVVETTQDFAADTRFTWRNAMAAVRAGLPSALQLHSAHDDDVVEVGASAWLFEGCTPAAVANATATSTSANATHGISSAGRRRLKSVNRVTGNMFAAYAVDLERALLTVEEGKLTASIHSILGTAPSPKWALLTLDSFSIINDVDGPRGSVSVGYYDYYVPGGGDPDVYVDNKRTCDSGAGLSGWNGICHDYAPTQWITGLSGGVDDRAVIIPLTTTSLEFKLWDDDYDFDDEIGAVSVAPFNSCSESAMSSGCAVTLHAQRDVSARWDSWWRYTTRRVTTATVQATLRMSGSMESKLRELNLAGKIVTEPRSALLDPDSLTSYWSFASYFASNVGYLLNGLLGDDPNVPISGIWAYRLQGSHSGGQLKEGPGADTTSIYSWNLTVLNMKEIGPALQRHDRYRRNELGIQIFNGAMWEAEKHYHTIALGDDNYDHARTRPLLDLMVGPQMASEPATKLRIGQNTDALLSRGSFSTGNMITEWGTVLLHKFHLGLDIPPSDATDFVSRMTPFLAAASGPSTTLASLGASSLLEWKANRLPMYETALATKVAHVWPSFSAVERTRVASTVLDSLLFAGGLSVPSVIRNALGVLYGHWGQAQLGPNFELTESKLLPFVMEVVRRFPPVGGFPSWDRRTNHHSVVDLLMAAADTDAWGPTADQFVLRPMHEYHQKSVMWADPALVDGDNAHPFSHACPAKDLSIVMAVEFLRAWLRRGGKACWSSDKAPADITINGYTTTEFTLRDVCTNPPTPVCTGSSSSLACPQAQMAPKTAQCAAAVDAGNMRVGTAPLPAAMRGVFWLTNQGDSSALMSFAQSNDGGGYSAGSIRTEGGVAEYDVRVGGDRVWSFMDRANSWTLVQTLDLVYQFDFADDAGNPNAVAPTRAQITPTAPNIFGLELSAAWLLNFSMRLLPDGTHATYPNSVVWARDTAVLNNNVPSAYYDLVQVVDASGNKLQPAWNDYVTFCGSADAGSTPGELHYRVASPVPTNVVSNGLWQTLVTAFDTRFGVYGRVIQLVLGRTSASWQKPTSLAVTVPTTMQNVPDVEIPLTGISVPKVDEHYPDTDAIAAIGLTALGAVAPFPLSGDECGEWAEGEDKIATIKEQIKYFPEHRSLVPWGNDRFSDRALSDLVFGGVGQHRIEPVGCAGCAVAPSSVPGSPRYAVLLNFAATLETRPGFAKLGADAYFDSAGNVLAIVRDGTTWTPSSNPGTEPVCTGFLLWKQCTNNIGWNHAKLAFRGTLMAVVTFIDHLYTLHFTIGNAIVRANVENVAPDHPLRRLLTPFGFRTEAINYQASYALVPENQLIHRGGPLTTAGIEGVFNYATATSKFISWDTIRARYKKAHVDIKLPFYEDGDLYYDAVRSFVRSYLRVHYSYTANTCGSDDGIVAWYNRVNSILPRNDLPLPITCEALEEVLATFMFYVSAMHNHAGTIAAEVEDPCFAPWAWREGELCGPPRTFHIHALIMMSTSLEQPGILEDYTHMFDDAASKQTWRDFTAALKVVGTEVARRNRDEVAAGTRRREFLSFATERIETAVSI